MIKKRTIETVPGVDWSTRKKKAPGPAGAGVPGGDPSDIHERVWGHPAVVAPRSESVSFLLFSSIELSLSLVTAVLGLTLITCDIYTCNAIHNINVEMKQ